MREERKINGINCPVEDLNPEIITLGHGSGGLLSQRLINNFVFKELGNDYLRTIDDAAILHMEGSTVFSTDSFVVSPIFFPGGNIGELAVNGTVNDLAMCGGIPKYISLSFILEEGLKLAEFRDIISGVKKACKASGVLVVTGDTKVVERGKGDKIFINTTGIGSMHPNAKLGINKIQAGDVLLVSGKIATHGISILSVREGLEFGTKLESDTTNLNHLVAKLLRDFGDSIHFLRDPTRGGLSSSLNEIALDRGLGIKLLEKDIPLYKEVEGACEMLGLDPLYVANEGIFLAIVEKNKANTILKKLHENEKGQFAKIIGEVTNEHPKQVVLQSKLGTRRVVNMLAGEQLPRIC